MTATTLPQGENFFERAIDWVEKEFAKVPEIEQSIAKFGNQVTDKIKALESNADVQALLGGLVTIAESIDPALTPMIQGIELEIPKILNFVTGTVTAVDAETAKPEAQQIADAAAKLKTIKTANPVVFAGLIGTVSTALQNYVTTNNGIVTTPAQLISSAVAVHAGA